MEHEYEYRMDTKIVHAGQRPCPDNMAFTTPIYQTATFAFDELLATGMPRGKYVYSRSSNPTNTTLEIKMAALEGGNSAVSFASGMAAITAAMLTILKSGDHLIADEVLYGSTYELLSKGVPRLGFDVSFVDMSDVDQVINAIKDTTKLIFFETPANPTLKLTDIRAITEIAAESSIRTIVDNTFLTPYFQRPLELGADIVVHSATKYLNGHGDALGGILITSFELADAVRKGALRDMGGVLSPFNAFLILRGIQTLSVRMERHAQNASKIATFLKKRAEVKDVFYPGHDRKLTVNKSLREQMSGFGGVLSFEVYGGLNESLKFLNGLKLCTIAVSLGDTASLIEHPGLMTHSIIPKNERDRIGITDGLIRLSVGLENVEDIKADIEQAFDQT
jgi:methionine-gamma-lyase